MDTQKFSDVEYRVKFMKGYWEFINSNQVQGIPVFDVDKAEKSIRKQHAKHYGLDSKYDGKGNLRELTY